MAITGEIRKRSGLIVTMVGLALFAFLVGDYFQSGSSIFGGDPRNVGEINGNEISLKDFSERMEQKKRFYQLANFTIDNQQGLLDEVWEELKFEYFIKEQYEEAGISVTGDELVNLANNDNPPQIIRQIFTNNYQSEYNKAMALNYFAAVQKNELPAEEKYAWKIRENLMVKVREIEKYSRYVVNGMYTTKLQAKKSYVDKNIQLDARVVGLDYVRVNPDSITVTDDEMQKYLDAHKEDYKQEEKASIEYVMVAVAPSSKDSAEALDYVASQLNDFKEAKDDSAFLRGITTVPYDKNNYQPHGSFEPEQEDKIFAADSGAVLGPFYSGGSYELIKVTGIKQDSVKKARASHILLQVEGTDTAKAVTQAQEYIRKIKNGERTFEDMAKEYGTDGSASRGGDLGWFSKGQMVKPFEDAVFGHKVGDIFVQKTQFGVHIIKVTEEPSSKMVRVARLRKPVEYSSETRDSLYDIVEAVATNAQTKENFEEVVLEQGLQIGVNPDIKPAQKSLPGLADASEVMRWIFSDDTKEGTTSDVMQIDDKLMVVKLINHRLEGTAKLEDVKDQVRAEVIKQKQGEILKERIETALAKANNDPQELARQLQTVVREIKGQSYEGATLQYFNNDYAVFGTLFALDKGEQSDIIMGDKGVYVAWVTDIRVPEVPEDLTTEKTQLERRITGAAAGAIEPAMNKGAGVVDKRYKYY